MKEIVVFGSGCAKCEKTADAIRAVANELAIPVSLSKETRAEVIMMAGVMRTPAVMVDGQLVHSGSIPHRQDIEAWLG